MRDADAPRFAQGGVIQGGGSRTDDRIHVFIDPHEQLMTRDGRIFRFEPCGGGLTTVDTGERVDIKSALDRLNTEPRSS